MEQYVIKGGNPLVGEVEIGGAKNAALAILAAATMTDETVTIENLPDVRDTNVLMQAMEEIGVHIDRIDRHTVKINAGSINDLVVDNEYIKKITPVNELGSDMLHAFVTGGIICTVGQASVMLMMKYLGMEKEAAQTWMLIELILASVLLTGFGIYPKIVKWGGAGALVPITGFANSVVAPAIEYKAEGHVFGIGCKIFTIAGPVILFGVLTSWILGILFLIGKFLGIM